MTPFATLHADIHTLLASISDSVEAHLVVATVLSGLLIALTFVVRDPRIRRAASLAALIVFLVPMPDLLPEQNLQSLQFPLFDVSAATTRTEAAPRTASHAVDAVCVTLAIWLTIVALLLARTIRDIVSQSHHGAPFPESVRQRFDVPDGIAVRVSGHGEGPHVAGLLRPVIIIPESLLSSSNDDELRAVLLHEITHVRQRDNLWGTLSAFITSLFWLHPFAWFAALRFRASSEIACDAAVLQSGIPLQTYLESLRKLIATAPSERVAQMALGGGSLKERIRIMKSSTRTLSRFASRLAIVTIAIATLGAGLSLRAMVGGEPPMRFALAGGDTVTAYRIAHEVTPLPNGILEAEFAIIDVTSNQLLGLATVQFLPGEPATLSTGSKGSATGDDYSLLIELDAIDSDTYSAKTEIRRAGELVEKTFDVTIADAPEPARPLDLSLTEAKLHDVLDLFAKLTQSELLVAADVSNQRVTINLKSVPWDRALDDVLLGRDLSWRKIGDLLIVSGDRSAGVSPPATTGGVQASEPAPRG